MTDTTIHRLKVRTTDDPLFATVARLANPPAIEGEQSLFLPAYAGFNIADGSDVDISYVYQPAPARPWTIPRDEFDRHLRTEELWLIMDGDGWLPLAPCRHPDDPEDTPRPEDMLCFAFKRGDLFVLIPNVWHCGPWPSAPDQPVRFYMCLSGHRQATSGGTVDHILRRFPNGMAILPDVDDAGRPI